MTTWEYATVPLIDHATKQILDQWGADGWELVQVLVMPSGGLVAYLKRPKAPSVSHRSASPPSGSPCPPVAAPVGAYVPATRSRCGGSHVGPTAARGRGPQADGRRGQTAGSVSARRRRRRARGSRALNALAALADAAGGIDEIARIVRVVGYVASAPGFTRPGRPS